MKTPAKKATKTAAKPTAKVSAPARKVSAKSPVKAKPAKPVVSKAKAKPVSKPAAKAATPKPAVKKAPANKAAATKAPAKPVPASKAAAKKAPVKKAPASKVPAKKAPAKQVPVKKAAPAKKPAAVKPAGVPKPAAAKPVAKPVSPVPKTVKSTPASKTPPATKALPVAKSAASPLAAAKPAASSAAAPAQPAPSADLPARSSRPSARLAQITVPSMPQAVASTAAKASFLPQMTTTVLPVAAAPAKKDPKLANNWKNKPVEQLSDAEVLAMPDGEYMNDVQMAFFRLKLVQLKQGILNNAGETTEHLREDTVVVPDPADRATIEEEHALELRTRDRERKLLKKIEQSIARIDAGDYGYCDETGEPIGVGRLLARPTATLSLEAQQRRELKQKMFGD